MDRRHIELSRRDWLMLSTLGIAGTPQCGWFQSVAEAAEGRPARRKSVIMLWMNGGPSTIDLWDMKPGHENGGPFKEIQTAVPGMRISQHLPQLAKEAGALAIIRSMATREGDHRRARIVSTTGYTPQGAIQFPSLGSLVAHERDAVETDLPGFVAIGSRDYDTEGLGAGFLGPHCSPLVIGTDNAATAGGEALTVPNLERPAGVDSSTLAARLRLLGQLDDDFHPGAQSAVAAAMRSAARRATRLMRPDVSGAFRIADESESLRDAYGRSEFGQGCLLARRLVERGVSFVEVALDGWDTHANNFAGVERLSAILDKAFSALLADLRSRGLLEDTLIVCQGEFGRTPRINGNSGRDHWPAAWAAVLAGGGIRGGHVIGKTSADGVAVESTPTRVADLIATVMHAIGIDPMKQNMSNVSRPIRIADPSGKPLEELL